MKTYIVETTDGEKVRQPYLATADDVRRVLADWLGDMATERDIARIYANARAMEAISWSEYGQGFKFINRFEPLDYLDTEDGPVYMNVHTGDTGHYTDWEYVDESGATVNAVDRGEVVQVRMVDGQWEAA